MNREVFSMRVLATVNVSDVGNFFSTAIQLITPFAILILGWIYNKRSQEAKEAENRRIELEKAKEDALNERIEKIENAVSKLERDMDNIQHDFEPAAEKFESEAKDILKRFDRVLDLTELILTYSSRIGSLTIALATAVLSTDNNFSDDALSLINEELSAVKKQEDELKMRIYKLGFTGGNEYE